jgi:hypothetical protein
MVIKETKVEVVTEKVGNDLSGKRWKSSRETLSYIGNPG